MAGLPLRRLLTLATALLTMISVCSADAVDFHWYPTAAQPCLYIASNSSQCDPSSVSVYNACVCGNGGGFLDTAASCLGSSDSGDLDTVYQTMSTNCANSNTPIEYTLQQWMQHAGSASSSASSSSSKTHTASTLVSTITAAATQTSAIVSTITLASASGHQTAIVSVVTVTPGQATVVTIGVASETASASSKDGGTSRTKGSSKLSTGVIAGIAAGAAGLAAAASGFIIWFIMRKRNRPIRGNTSYAPVPSYGGSYGGSAGEIKDYGNGNYATAPQHDPEPTKYSYANQNTAGQPMYGGQQYHDYPGQQAFANQGVYVEPHSGAMELQGGYVELPHELPAVHY